MRRAVTIAACGGSVGQLAGYGTAVDVVVDWSDVTRSLCRPLVPLSLCFAEDFTVLYGIQR